MQVRQVNLLSPASYIINDFNSFPLNYSFNLGKHKWSQENTDGKQIIEFYFELNALSSIFYHLVSKEISYFKFELETSPFFFHFAFTRDSFSSDSYPLYSFWSGLHPSPLFFFLNVTEANICRRITCLNWIPFSFFINFTFTELLHIYTKNTPSSAQHPLTTEYKDKFKIRN